MYEIKTEHVYKDFSSNTKMFDFSNYSTKSKYYDNSNGYVNNYSEKLFLSSRSVMLITIQKSFFCPADYFNFQSNQNSFFVSL